MIKLHYFLISSDALQRAVNYIFKIINHKDFLL